MGGGRYLIGCSSLTSQDPAHGTAVFRALEEYQKILPDTEACSSIRTLDELMRQPVG
jgi:hypothetical protein